MIQIYGIVYNGANYFVCYKTYFKINLVAVGAELSNRLNIRPCFFMCINVR